MTNDELFRAVQRMEGKLDRICDTLHGKDGNNGLTTRVRLLEESEKTRKWYMRTLAGGVLAAIGAAIWNRVAGS